MNSQEERDRAVRLWQAVVLQAVLDASYANPSKQYREEARRYVFSKTFLCVCMQVHLNGRHLRARMDDPSLFRRLKNFQGGPQRGKVDAEDD